MITTKNPIIAVVGPTASGKTALGIELAKRHNGEIICADSRTIYRGMDIGTAKPNLAEREGITHHFLDIIEPNQVYSAQEFKVAAETVIKDIIGRGKLPILVGGTGLYVYALLYDYQFPAGGRTDERAVLESKPLDELVAILQQKDPDLATEIDLRNTRRVIRAIETAGQARQKSTQLADNILLVGLRPESTTLYTNISQRTQRMFQIGLVSEVGNLVQNHGMECEAFRSPGYAEIVEHLAGVKTLEEAAALIDLHTRQLVKRQLTWFNRNHEIQWVEDPEQALKLARDWLDYRASV
jgi:tRNA dimethylallyltransferase